MISGDEKIFKGIWRWCKDDEASGWMVDYIFIPFLKSMKQTPIFDMALRQILMLVIVLLSFIIFPLWNCTGFYLAMSQKEGVQCSAHTLRICS